MYSYNIPDGSLELLKKSTPLSSITYHFTHHTTQRPHTPINSTQSTKGTEHNSRLNIFIEPCYCLQERLLLRKLLPLLANISAHGEPMLDAGEQVDLVRHVHLQQNLLCLMAFGRGENLIGFCSPDSQPRSALFPPPSHPIPSYPPQIAERATTSPQPKKNLAERRTDQTYQQR